MQLAAGWCMGARGNEGASQKPRAPATSTSSPAALTGCSPRRERSRRQPSCRRCCCSGRSRRRLDRGPYRLVQQIPHGLLQLPLAWPGPSNLGPGLVSMCVYVCVCVSVCLCLCLCVYGLTFGWTQCTRERWRESVSDGKCLRACAHIKLGASVRD